MSKLAQSCAGKLAVYGRQRISPETEFASEDFSRAGILSIGKIKIKKINIATNKKFLTMRNDSPLIYPFDLKILILYLDYVKRYQNRDQ
jgi:hypothetical protein